MEIPGPAKVRLLYLLKLLEKSGTIESVSKFQVLEQQPLKTALSQSKGRENARAGCKMTDFGTGFITSSQIESITGWSSYTIRKDISYLGGELGSTSGYESGALGTAIKQGLCLDKPRKLCVVGLGRLGSAYLNFSAFDKAEFELAAGFDTNVNRVEILQSPVPLYPAYKMAEIIGRFSIEIALLCVPEAQAQAAADKLTAAGIRGIVNFAPVVLSCSPEIAVRNVYVVDELRALSIQMA